MIPFQPDPNWYEQTWYGPAPERPRRTPIFAQTAFGVVVVLITLVGAVLS